MGALSRAAARAGDAAQCRGIPGGTQRTKLVTGLLNTVFQSASARASTAAAVNFANIAKTARELTCQHELDAIHRA